MDSKAPASARSKGALTWSSSSMREIHHESAATTTTAGMSIHSKVERRLRIAMSVQRLEAIADAPQGADLYVRPLQFLAQAVDDDFDGFHVDGLIVPLSKPVKDEGLVDRLAAALHQDAQDLAFPRRDRQRGVVQRESLCRQVVVQRTAGQPGLILAAA